MVAIWQVTALAIVVGVVTRLACRRRPHLAYVLWMLVLLKCLTPPLWSSPTGCFSWAQLRVVQVESEVRSGDADATADFGDRQRVATVFGHRDFLHRPHDSSPAVAPAMPVSPIVATSPASSWWDRVSIATILAAVWLVGSLGLAGLLRWKWAAYRRALKHSAVTADAEIQLLAAQLGERLGLRRRVRIMVTTEPIGPAVFGLLRPAVVLPQGNRWRQTSPLSHWERGRG